MELHTDFPERLHPGVQVYLGEAHQPARITGTRGHNEGMLIKFDHTDTPEDAARHTNQLVYVTRADRPPLPPGQYYYHELIGFEVVDENDVSFGRLSEILETGANDVYVVARPDGGELLIPVIPSVMLAIDAARQRIIVHLPDGLIPD